MDHRVGMEQLVEAVEVARVACFQPADDDRFYLGGHARVLHRGRRAGSAACPCARPPLRDGALSSAKRRPIDYPPRVATHGPLVTTQAAAVMAGGPALKCRIVSGERPRFEELTAVRVGRDGTTIPEGLHPLQAGRSCYRF
jgi:hypothetical protein